MHNQSFKKDPNIHYVDQCHLPTSTSVRLRVRTDRQFL
jgi:hypothetical protein